MALALVDGKVINGLFGGVRTLKTRVDRIDRLFTKDLWKEVCALHAQQNALVGHLEMVTQVTKLLSGKCLGVTEGELYDAGADDNVWKWLGLPMVLGSLHTVGESKPLFPNPDATPFTPIRPSRTTPEFSTAEKRVCFRADWDMQDEPVMTIGGKGSDEVNGVETQTLTQLHQLCVESLQLLTDDHRKENDLCEDNVVGLPILMNSSSISNLTLALKQYLFREDKGNSAVMSLMKTQSTMLAPWMRLRIC